MIKKILIIIGACIFLGGCTSNTEKSSDTFDVGEYSSSNGTISFKEDNTFSYSLNNGLTGSGIYTTSDDEITLTENNKHYYLYPKYRAVTYMAEKSDELFSSNENLYLPASVEGDTIYMSSGETFDFTAISPDIVSIKITSYTKKDNINNITNKDNVILILRDSGYVTTYDISNTSLRIVTSDGADELTVEVEMKDGTTKEYKVSYDCHCG